MSSGCRFRGGWLWGPGRDLAAQRADLVGSGGGWRRGALAFSFWASLGRGPAMCEAVWVGVRGGEQFARAAFGGWGGVGLGFLRCARGACAGNWAGWACRGAWGSPRWVCAGCRVWGMVRGVRRVHPWRACAVVWAGGGCQCRGARGARDGGRVWVSGRAARGEGHGRGLRVGVCCVGVCVRSQRRACVVSCRPGGLEEKLAVFRCRGKDFAEELAY